MRDMNLSQEYETRILSWMFILLMRLYGQNVYSDDSYIYKVFECESLEEIDLYFENVLAEFKTKHRDIARLQKLQVKIEDILSR
jgi:hypothetical protein